MEAEATVHSSNNGVEKTAPAAELPKVQEVAPVAAATFGVQGLLDKRQEMGQTINNSRATRDQVADQLANLEDMLKRQEGAYLQLGELITELDPQIARQMGITRGE